MNMVQTTIPGGGHDALLEEAVGAAIEAEFGGQAEAENRRFVETMLADLAAADNAVAAHEAEIARRQTEIAFLKTRCTALEASLDAMSVGMEPSKPVPDAEPVALDLDPAPSVPPRIPPRRVA
ncbi:hypothetical protein [Oricola cellulosilytica]|uniref:Accessory factor UbiK family protein n=1 Tax=Oricola cellulosilytica TaxID=1429082 RepID=A0A4R0PCH6_9HYPH|nr:hypothetical protein [Oricola cellulosilytica]TCD15170.1 hypothetical protein E0D97_06370 [Oricola cellulosilytica]